MFEVMLTLCTGVAVFDCLCIRTVKTFVEETMLFGDHSGTALKALSSKRNYFAGSVLTVPSIFLFWWTFLFPNNHVIYCNDQVQKRNKVKCLHHVFEHFLPERNQPLYSIAPQTKANLQLVWVGVQAIKQNHPK